jgi:hypothetical protein
MEDYKQEMIAYAQSEIDRIQSFVDLVVPLIPDGIQVPNAKRCHCTEYGVVMTLPYSTETYNNILDKMFESGWDLDHEKKREDIGELELNFTHPKLPYKYYTKYGKDCPLRIFLDPDLPGATCRRIQVAEYQGRIYHIVCNETGKEV